MRYALSLGLGLCVLGLCACAKPAVTTTPARSAASVDAARLDGADQDRDNWLTHGRNYGEQRFSPLDQINAGNVSTLGLAWALDLDTSRGQEATPLVVDGVMYSTSAWSKVQAIDAASGRLLWQYDPQVPGETGIKACCDVVNRGVAVWQGRVYVGTLDGRLVAIDAASGKEVWSVVTVDQTKKYTITGAPRIIKGRVLIGNGGAEFGVRGYISAYDANDGKLLWRFYTVPGDPSQPFESDAMKTAAATWSGEWWKLGGGGTVWDSMAYDASLDLLYIGTGNGSPWNQRIRSPGGGDNLYLSSIVALRPETGEYVWHYQTTPGESWDYTATQHIILADVALGGEARRVLMQAPKNGFFYVLDRTTGKLLSAKPFTTINWATDVDLATGRPLINPDAQYAQTGKPWFAMPGPLGAHNWQPMSWSPQTRLVYIPAQDIPFAYADDKNFAPNPLAFNIGIDINAAAMPADAQAKAQLLATVRGYLKAWDPVAQKEVWRVEEPGPWNGGVVSTGGNLVFAGNAAGFLNAYSADKGKKLWSFQTQTGVIAAPISYAVGGQQYVAVVAGWGGAFPLTAGEVALKGSLPQNHSRVLAFRLGGTASLPPVPPAQQPTKPPARFGEQAQLGVGALVYGGYCSVCHGPAVVAAGVLPDLRWSPMIASPDAWHKVVLEGTRQKQGMVSFAQVLTPELAELVRAFVVSRANDSYQDPNAPAQPAAAPAAAAAQPAAPAPAAAPAAPGKAAHTPAEKTAPAKPATKGAPAEKPAAAVSAPGAEKAPAAAPAPTAACGDKGQPQCPLQGFMEHTLQAAVDANDGAALARALNRVAGFVPDPSWNSGAQGWSSLAQSGAKAAESGDLATAKQSCKGCHKAWRSKYRATFRPRALP
ncbi:MAG: PQQ-dependent dehydrogenase, methanol/ethanol family [Polyangiales bacterium]